MLNYGFSEIPIPFKMNKLIVNITKVRNHSTTRFQRQIIDCLMNRLCMIFCEFIFYLYQFFPIIFLWNAFRLKINNVIVICCLRSFLDIVRTRSQRAQCFPQFSSNFQLRCNVLLIFILLITFEFTGRRRRAGATKS